MLVGMEISEVATEQLEAELVAHAAGEAAGNPVDRSIPSTDFVVAPPDYPDEIGGRWYGDHLDLDQCLAAFGVGG